MFDLLGDPVDLNPPADPRDGFDAFWQAYPSGPRRVGKPQALKKWIALGLSAKTVHITAHVHHMKTEDCWVRGFHPMVLTYLNQQRWLDWEPPPPKALKQDELARIKAHVGVKPSKEVLERIARIKQGIAA